MTDDVLTVDVALPRLRARFVVDPSSLAPWTADYFRHFPTFAQRPQAIYRLRQLPGAMAISTPAGTQRCRPDEAAPLWDTTLRHVLRHAGGAPLLHAALVERGGRALLLAGVSGAGKTTTLLTLVDRGWRYGGDEYALLRPDGILALPRCLEFGDAKPTDVDAAWSYPGPDGTPCWFGHRRGLRACEPLPWRDVAGIVTLSPARAPRTSTTRTKPPLRGHWHNPPSWRHWHTLYRYAGLPAWQVRGGPPEAIADRCERLLAGQAG